MRTKVDITIEDIYKQYCNENEKVDKKIFKEVLYTLNKLISEAIIEDGRTCKLPYSLASISIRKKEMEFSKLHFDFAEYNRTGIKSVYLNKHSDEFYAFPYWEKSKAVIPNKSAYRFDLTRENKRKLASIMKTKNGHQIYELSKS